MVFNWEQFHSEYPYCYIFYKFENHTLKIIDTWCLPGVSELLWQSLFYVILWFNKDMYSINAYQVCQRPFLHKDNLGKSTLSSGTTSWILKFWELICNFEMVPSSFQVISSLLVAELLIPSALALIKSYYKTKYNIYGGWTYHLVSLFESLTHWPLEYLHAILT